MHSDLDIVKKTLSDGNEYFEPLITRYNNYIFSIMMRLTSGNVDFSEDLTQLSSVSYTHLTLPTSQYV